MPTRVSPAKGRQLAKECGMEYNAWLAAKIQARDARSRGRKAPGESSKLDSWGPVEGQMTLFTEEV